MDGFTNIQQSDVEIKVVLPSMIWGQICFAARESEDAYLRQLIEQAAAAASALDITWKPVTT